MANLIDNTYFIDDIMLPGKLIDGSTLSIIDTYITKYEKEVLMALLGYDLYKDLIANPSEAKWVAFTEGEEYTVGEHTVKWNGLTNSDKISFIAYYVYFHVMRDLVTSTTTAGEILSTLENADRITPSDKMANAWQRFRELYGSLDDGEFVPSAYRYLTEKESDFDLWLFTSQGTINSFGI